MANELKPCPFCGGEAHIAELSNGSQFITFYTVNCNQIAHCFGSDSNSWYGDKDQAIEAWNRRATDGD